MRAPCYLYLGDTLHREEDLAPWGEDTEGRTLHPGVREDTPHRGRSNRRGQLGFTRGGDKTPVDYNIYCKRLTVSGY